jgi:hypothetical protein
VRTSNPTLRAWSSFRVRGHVWHRYETTSKTAGFNSYYMD